MSIFALPWATQMRSDGLELVLTINEKAGHAINEHLLSIFNHHSHNRVTKLLPNTRNNNEDMFQRCTILWSSCVTQKTLRDNDPLGSQNSVEYNEQQTQHSITTRVHQFTTKALYPTKLKLLTNSTGLNLAWPSPSSATSSLTLPPLAATTVLLLLNPLCLGVLQGVVPISPSISSPSGVAPGVLILQLYNEEFVGYNGDTIVAVCVNVVAALQ
jgi:hypothetical protein